MMLLLLVNDNEGYLQKRTRTSCKCMMGDVQRFNHKKIMCYFELHITNARSPSTKSNQG